MLVYAQNTMLVYSYVLFTHSPIFSSFPYLPLYSIMPPFHREAYLCVCVDTCILHDSSPCLLANDGHVNTVCVWWYIGTCALSAHVIHHYCYRNHKSIHILE